MFSNVISRIGHKIGFTTFNVHLLRGLKRPEWLYRNRKSIPFQPLYFSPVPPVTPQDVALCERLMAAYKKATAEIQTTELISKIWTVMLGRYGKLLSALDSGDPQVLAKTLSTMFREAFVFGVGTGDTYFGSRTKIGSRIWSQRYFEDLVSLAEYVGAARTECVEQGEIGWAFKDGAAELIAKIERAVGIPINFPSIGSPYGIKIGETLITFEAPEHIYVAARINEAINAHVEAERGRAPHIVEIGAGFGGTAHWLLKLRRDVGSYTIIDLPLINVLQGYFLAEAFGAERVSLYGEDGAGAGATSAAPPKLINVRPAHSLDTVGGAGVDVLVNENSMPEMPPHIVEKYLAWAKERVTGIFYSYNHEAHAPYEDEPQVLVPEALARTGGFKRLSRNSSWVRRGYV
ncbi:MAG TPA: putative sugar O-methyltransferase, partial [Pyrinomonadaceae bacterium]